MHHIGDGMHSPCLLQPADVYRGLQAGFTNAWAEVDCPACLEAKPGGLVDQMAEPTPQEGGFLQVFMSHEDMIERFKQWVAAQGWELQAIPRFADDSSDEDYVKTHIIVPQKLGQLLAERAAQHRKDHPNEP
jgi:hypothetical protein